MNWYKLSQNTSNISIDLSDFIKSLDNRINQAYHSISENKERISNLTIDRNEIINGLKQFDYPNIGRLQVILNSNDIRLLNRMAHDVFKFYLNFSKNNFDKAQPLRLIYKKLSDLTDQLENADPEKFLSDMNIWKKGVIEQTNTNMIDISNKVKEAILRAATWNGSPITIIADPLYKENEAVAEINAHINVGGEDSSGFAYWPEVDGKLVIEDVVEAGDPDIFPNRNIESDYFTLIKELKSPGSTSKAGKVLTLFTARPIKDRSLLDGAKQIPSNIFLTSSYSSAGGLAHDLGENEVRDIYRIKIDSRYLMQTLDGLEKQYQVVGNGFVPVVEMKMIDPGE
jgi:hypothetical protein